MGEEEEISFKATTLQLITFLWDFKIPLLLNKTFTPRQPLTTEKIQSIILIFIKAWLKKIQTKIKLISILPSIIKSLISPPLDRPLTKIIKDAKAWLARMNPKMIKFSKSWAIGLSKTIIKKIINLEKIWIKHNRSNLFINRIMRKILSHHNPTSINLLFLMETKTNKEKEWWKKNLKVFTGFKIKLLVAHQKSKLFIDIYIYFN